MTSGSGTFDDICWKLSSNQTLSITGMELFDINRNALIITRSRAFVELTNQIYPDDYTDFDTLDINDSAYVYLTPEFEDVLEAENWLEKNYLPFLETMLEDWIPDEDKWPNDRSFETFKKHCDYNIQFIVVDTVDVGYDNEEE